MSDLQMHYLFSFLGALIIALVAYCFGLKHGTEGQQLDAIRVGVAEFYLDQNSQRAWRWKPTENTK